MSAAVSRARSLADARSPEAERAVELADLFCRNSSRKVRRLFRDIWSNEDDRKNGVAAKIMGGDFAWLEQGRLDVGLTPESFQQRFLTKSKPVEEKPREAATGT
jgi:hypothetical protein